jgi:hypothetical protein
MGGHWIVLTAHIPCKKCIESWDSRIWCGTGAHAQAAPVDAPTGWFGEVPTPSPILFGDAERGVEIVRLSTAYPPEARFAVDKQARISAN